VHRARGGRAPCPPRVVSHQNAGLAQDAAESVPLLEARTRAIPRRPFTPACAARPCTGASVPPGRAGPHARCESSEPCPRAGSKHRAGAPARAPAGRQYTAPHHVRHVRTVSTARVPHRCRPGVSPGTEASRTRPAAARTHDHPKLDRVCAAAPPGDAAGDAATASDRRAAAGPVLARPGRRPVALPARRRVLLPLPHPVPDVVRSSRARARSPRGHRPATPARVPH
jgi:hypothetical protein